VFTLPHRRQFSAPIVAAIRFGAHSEFSDTVSRALLSNFLEPAARAACRGIGGFRRTWPMPAFMLIWATSSRARGNNVQRAILAQWRWPYAVRGSDIPCVRGKLIDAASKTWRRLKGTNQLPKIVAGVRFADGIEVVQTKQSHAA